MARLLLRAIVLAAAMFALADDARAHNLPYSLARIDFDAAGTRVLIECHLAALAMGLPQAELRPDQKMILSATADVDLERRIEAARAMLMAGTAFRAGAERVAPVAVTFPPVEAVRAQAVAVDRTAIPSYPIVVEFPPLPPGQELVLVLPEALGATMVLLALPSGESFSAMVGAGRESPAFSRDGEADFLATFRHYLGQGFLHIVPEGMDHVLFIAAIFFASFTVFAVIAQATLFTLAHSITLAAVALGWLPGTTWWVEPAIAATIAYAGAENVFKIASGRPRKLTRMRYMIVFAFGLIHGMGFAGAFAELGLPVGSLTVALAGFNLGVEFGQIGVILVMAALFVPAAFRWQMAARVAGSLFIAAAGLLWLAERLEGLAFG